MYNTVLCGIHASSVQTAESESGPRYIETVAHFQRKYAVLKFTIYKWKTILLIVLVVEQPVHLFPFISFYFLRLFRYILNTRFIFSPHHQYTSTNSISQTEEKCVYLFGLFIAQQLLCAIRRNRQKVYVYVSDSQIQ